MVGGQQTPGSAVWRGRDAGANEQVGAAACSEYRARRSAQDEAPVWPLLAADRFRTERHRDRHLADRDAPQERAGARLVRASREDQPGEQRRHHRPGHE
jgi:hypothetical protein